MTCGTVATAHNSSVVMADKVYYRRSSGRSSLSSWSQRSSASSVFSRWTNRTSASSTHSDMPYAMSYTESSGPAPHVPNATRQRLAPFSVPIQGGDPPHSRRHDQGYRGVSIHGEPSGPAPNFYETRRLQQEFESQLQGRFSDTTQEHGRATRAAGASMASDEVLWEREIENEPRSSSA